MKKAIKWIHKRLIMLLRLLLQIIRDIDGLFTWASTFWIKTTPITGQCKQRGICCRNIAVGLNPHINKYQKLVWLANMWYTFVYNFKLKGWYHQQEVLMYECKYLIGNKCSIHWRRPLMCRRYPVPLKKKDTAQFLPGCGYSLTKSTVKSFGK